VQKIETLIQLLLISTQRIKYNTMSSRISVTRKTSHNTASASAVEKPFCGVCYNSGKTEKEYTSHYTKSVPGPKGFVCCPTILDHTCEYCKEKGHFKVNCRVLKHNEKMKMNLIEKKDSKPIKHKNMQKILNNVPVSAKKHTFALAFGGDSDDEEDVVRTKEKGVIRIVSEEKTPAEVIFVPKQYKISYSMVAKMPAKEKKDAPIQAAKKTIEELNLFDYMKPPAKKIVMHSWADDDYWASDDE